MHSLIEKDAEILGLKKQVNAYKQLTRSMEETIKWKVEDGVKFKINSIQEELKTLNSEKEINQILTNENEFLTKQVAVLTEALKLTIEDSFEVLSDYLQKYGENYKPQRIKYQQEVILKAENALKFEELNKKQV